MLLTEWPPVKTTVEELPESRVRLEVEVPEADVQHAMEHAASDLAASLRIPGFRKGKAPVQVVAARVGREALWEEAMRSHLDSWFWNAAASSGVRPVANPAVDFGDAPPPEAGELSARFGIRSIPTLVVFHGGREVARQTGALDRSALDRWVSAELSKLPPTG